MKLKKKHILTPHEIHRLQRERHEESMKVKSMRGLLARLEVTLHHKEKRHVIEMIAKLSSTMNNFGNEKKQTSTEMKDLIHTHIVQQEHLQQEILDLKIQEGKCHEAEMKENKLLQIAIEERDEKLELHRNIMWMSVTSIRIK